MLLTLVAFVLFYSSGDPVPEKTHPEKPKVLAAKLFFDALHMRERSRNAEGCKGDDQRDRKDCSKAK